MSEIIPQDRIRVFDQSGRPLCSFHAAIDRSWAINEEGRAQFKLPTRDTALVNETNFRYGNWLLVENSILPPWVGVLDTPRQSDALEMTFHAYTPEHVLTHRIAPIDETVAHDAGGWFNWFIHTVNAAFITILQSGNIYHDGKVIQKQVSPKYLSEYLQEITEESLQEYEFIPQVNNGRLSLIGNWSSLLGVDTQTTLKSLSGNVEASSPLIIDDGPLANDIFLFGDGASWSSRPYAKAWDLENIARYGLRHYVEEIQGVTDVSTLQKIADTKLAKMKRGVKIFSLHALNVGDTFAALKLGNRLKTVLSTSDFGYSGDVRIIGMNYEPLTPNKVELVLEEVF